jgi:hypothetical protein
MYGGASKPESYCKITVYLQHNAPLLYENIQDLCLFGAFNTRGSNGVTFLLPDKKTQEKIDKMVGQDARKAVAMINACILPVYLKDIDEFRERQDDIPNALGNKLNIKEVTSSSVELSNGAKITRDSKFKRLYDTANVAVFSLDGEVPTAGDASQAMSNNKKRGSRGTSKNLGSRGTRGGYDGGNDNALIATHLKSGNSHGQIAKEARSVVVSRLGLGEIDQLTHLGLSLINYLLKQTGELEKLGRLLCYVHPVSPLYFLFCICLLTEDEIEVWQKTIDNEYNNLKTLEKHLGMGLGQQIQKDVYNEVKHRNNVTALDAHSICSTIIEYAGQIQGQYLKEEDFNFARFEGKDGFKHWMVLMSEFTFLFTGLYTKAITDGDKQSIEKIFDIYDRWILRNAVQHKWKDALTLVNPLFDNMLPSKERFCTILSLFVSHRFFPMGGNLKALAATEDGVKDDVTYGGTLAPNLIVPTSDEHITAKFWIRRVKD